MTRMETLMTKILASLCQIMNWRTVLGLALFAALSACAPAPQIASVNQSLRVNSINVIIPVKSKHGKINWAHGGHDNQFPPERIGLSKSKIRSDFSAVLRREIIPATKNGQRVVNVQIEIYNMSLRGPGHQGPADTTAMVSIMDVTDAATGDPVISDEWMFLNSYQKKSYKEIWAISLSPGNYIRSYNTLLRLFPADIRKRLLK